MLESLDLDAMLLTKSLIKQGLNERNNPDAVSMREVNHNVMRAEIVRKRFEEIGSGKRRHRL